MDPIVKITLKEEYRYLANTHGVQEWLARASAILSKDLSEKFIDPFERCET